jgi:hypothetical protein
MNQKYDWDGVWKVWVDDTIDILRAWWSGTFNVGACEMSVHVKCELGGWQ